jgi:hypothetical protein
MDNKITAKELSHLKAIFDFGILSMSQFTLLCFPSRQMARKKVKELVRHGLIELIPSDFGKSPGRPEYAVRLSQKGLAILGEGGGINSEALSAQPEGTGMNSVQAPAAIELGPAASETLGKPIHENSSKFSVSS